MKTMALAALAALLAVARTAAAQQGSDPLAEVRSARADGEALLTSMYANARVAREVLELARSRKRIAEIRCSDEALSRADVALRRGREDADDIRAAFASGDAKAATAALHRLQARATASHDAATTASQCIVQPGVRGTDRTQVIVRVTPSS
jgi:hypothetical protein